jgi:Domain of unknown function (DUF4157)
MNLALSRKQKPESARKIKPSNFSQTLIQHRVSPQENIVQRKSSSCACGGSCPRCQANTAISTKLKISEPGDEYEQEADRVADQVMRMPELSVKQQVEPEEEMIQRKAIAPSTTQKASEVPLSVGNVLQSPSQPLDPATRNFMESRFGCDFSQVRVHSGTEAEQSAQVVNANAYTVGHNIVFGAGRFAPGTHKGKRLIAHELTHVVQNRGVFPADSPILSREPETKAIAAPPPSPTTAASVPLTWTWKDLAVYPLLVDVWKDLVLKELTPADRNLLSLKGSEGAAFYAWTMAVGLAPTSLGGGDKPKDFGDYLKGTYNYADALTGLTPAKDSIFDPLSRIVGLRVDDYLSSDLFMTRLKAHTASVVSLALVAQGTYSLIQGVKKKNDDPTALEGDAWTQQTGLVKALVSAIFKEQLTAPNFFDVGPLQLATHPAFSAAPFAGGGVPSGLTFERNQDVDNKVREQKYGLTLNLPKFIKPGDASASDIGDPSKYRDWQGSAWFTYDSNDPLKVTPDKQPDYKLKGGTIFGSGGHLGELEAGAQYGGDTGKDLTTWFARGGYGYAAGEKETGLKKIGFTATFIDWKENYVLAPRNEGGAAAGGWGLKTTPFVSTNFNVGDKKTIDASAAISFVTGNVGDAKTSVGISDVSLGLSYTYLGESATGKLPVFKLDLSGSMNRLDWWNPNSPLLWGVQVKGNVGNYFGGVKVMSGAGVKTTADGGGIPESRLDILGPTVKTMVPSAVLFTGGYAF